MKKILYRVDNFPLLGGGLNTTDEPYNIRDNQAQESWNVISEDGKTIETRKGFIPYNTSAISGSPAIYGMERAYLHSGSQFMVKAGTKLYKGFQSALSTELKTGLVAGSMLAYAVKGDYTYMSSKDDTPFVRQGGESSTFQNGITKPSSAPTFTLGTGNLNAKKGHKLGYTYYDHIKGTESNLSELSVSTGIFDNSKITISVIASGVSRVTKIRIYLTKDEGETGEIAYFAQEVPDATASIELDLKEETFTEEDGETHYIGIGGLTKEAPTDHDLPPKGEFLIIHNNQAFSAGDTAHPRRISHTPVNELEHWPDDYRQDVDGMVTGLFELRGELFATTSQQILYWDGTGWSVRMSDTGCRVGGSISTGEIMSSAGIPVEVAFLYRQSGIYGFDTQSVQLLSENLGDLDDWFNENYIDNLASFFSNWKYEISYTSKINNRIGEDTNGTYNNRTLILDTKRMTWWPQKYGFNCASVWDGKGDNNEIMIGNSASDGYVYWLEQGYSDNGTAIEVTYKTKDFDFGLKDFDKIIRRLETEYEFLGGTLRARYSVDDATLATLKTLPTYTSGSVYGTAKYGTATYSTTISINSKMSFPSGKRGRRCYLEFYKKDDNQRVHIKRLTLQIIPKVKQLR